MGGDQVADLVTLNAEVVDTALSTVDKALGQTDTAPTRDVVADQILRETLLTVSSDWPFMVSKDSAADYARYRAPARARHPRDRGGHSPPAAGDRQSDWWPDGTVRTASSGRWTPVGYRGPEDEQVGHMSRLGT